MNERVRLQVRTGLDPEAWTDVGAGGVGISLPITVESDIDTYYSTNNVDTTTTADTVYIGSEDKDGNWLVERINTSTLAFTYATILNNPTVLTYANAWSARATTAVYGIFSVAF